MTNIKHFGLTALLSCLMGLSACSDPDTSASDAAVAVPSLLPSEVIERIAERSAPRFAEGVTAPSLIVDPS